MGPLGSLEKLGGGWEPRRCRPLRHMRRAHLSPDWGQKSGGPVMASMLVAWVSFVDTLLAYWHPSPHVLGTPRGTYLVRPLGSVVV